MGFGVPLAPGRSETAPLAPENAPLLPPGHYFGGAYVCDGCRNPRPGWFMKAGNHGVAEDGTQCFNDAHDVGDLPPRPLDSPNPRIAAAWKKLADALGLTTEEIEDFSLLEAVAALAEAKTQRERHAALAAGSPAVAGEFYEPCGRCGAPVDVRGPVAHVDCEGPR